MIYRVTIDFAAVRSVKYADHFASTISYSFAGLEAVQKPGYPKRVSK